MNIELNEAISVLNDALSCYIEDCISSDSEAQNELHDAWKTILERVNDYDER